MVAFVHVSPVCGVERQVLIDKATDGGRHQPQIARRQSALGLFDRCVNFAKSEFRIAIPLEQGNMFVFLILRRPEF